MNSIHFQHGTLSILGKKIEALPVICGATILITALVTTLLAYYITYRVSYMTASGLSLVLNYKPLLSMLPEILSTVTLAISALASTTYFLFSKEAPLASSGKMIVQTAQQAPKEIPIARFIPSFWRLVIAAPQGISVLPSVKKNALPLGLGKVVVINSPLSGKCAEKKCKEGELVAAGAVVYVLEAMKMYSLILTPKAGKITKLNYQPGDLVNSGAPLFSLDI